MSPALKYRGIEAWLEDNHGIGINLTAPPLIDKESHTISTVVRLQPKAGFTLHWRRATGLEPISAICRVFIQKGFFTVDTASEDFCIANLTMDKNRRVTQSRASSGHLNPPYKRHGLIRLGRESDYPSHAPRRSNIGPDSANTVPCLRLEIRRVRGTVCTPEWVIGYNDLETSVIDLDEMDVIDDEKKDMLPFVVFEFEFPDTLAAAAQDMDNQPPRVKIGTTHLKHSLTKEGIPANDGNLEKYIDVNLRSSDSQETLVVSAPSFSRAEANCSGETSSSRAPILVDDCGNEDQKPARHPSEGFVAAHAGKRKTREWDDPMKSSLLRDVKPSVKRESSILDTNLKADYCTVDQLEKELHKQLAEKIKTKQSNIEELRRLLGSE
ncbi:hypothetical protein GALMADRAFT_135338 [Galerina marginata CBS 339.88]|uniref:Uncharacterized protein n=1 Tax=Galerina marginata (strain CBS 339.88) TaxID=685588 RepID=A0A067TQ03_GALM3|nr:hypothetical protein GALMADRAFT_135338 [Galerina marginata CBS 339.88]